MLRVLGVAKSTTSSKKVPNFFQRRSAMYFSRRIGNALPFSRMFRQLEQEVETVVKVLQPGPLGIIEHKFSSEEILEANARFERAVENWRRTAEVEQMNGVLKDYIHK